MVDVVHEQLPAPRRGRLRNVALESPEFALFVADVVVLIVIAAFVGATAVLFADGSWIRPGYPAALVLPAAVLLVALNLGGAYTADALAHPGRTVRRIGLLWVLLQSSLVATISGSGADLGDLDRRLLLFAFLAPIALVPHRAVFALLARRAAAAGERLQSVFLVAETSAIADAYSPKHRFSILPSFSSSDPHVLQRLLYDIQTSGCDEIHLVPRNSSSILGDELVRALRLSSAPIRLIASAEQAALLRFPISRVGSGFAFDIQRPRIRLVDRLLKRSFDLTASLLLCVFFAPLLGLVAIAIKLASRGPVFFRQPRIGRDGQVFLIYKFRTMSVQEIGVEVRQATRRDPRVTRLGRVLRASSIDELPQLFNVLSGEMSLVGPRPHAVAHDHDFAERSADYRIRQLVKPGLTGLAQVSGARGEIADPASLERRVAFDLRYVEEWSLALDFRILVRTFATVFCFRSAY